MLVQCGCHRVHMDGSLHFRNQIQKVLEISGALGLFQVLCSHTLLKLANTCLGSRKFGSAELPKMTWESELDAPGCCQFPSVAPLSVWS